MAEIGDTVFDAQVAAWSTLSPSIVVQVRIGGSVVTGLRVTPAAQMQDGQYGAMIGVTAQVRFKKSALPGGVKFEDGQDIEIKEDGEYKIYRVNGMQLTAGIYRFEPTDKY